MSIAGPKGNATGQFHSAGPIADRPLPPRWGIKGPGEMVVKGHVVFGTNDEREIAGKFTLSDSQASWASP